MQMLVFVASGQRHKVSSPGRQNVLKLAFQEHQLLISELAIHQKQGNMKSDGSENTRVTRRVVMYLVYIISRVDMTTLLREDP